MRFLIIIGLLAAGMLLLSVGVIFRQDHRFHSEDVGANKDMRKRGIHCTKTQDRLMRRENPNKIKI